MIDQYLTQAIERLNISMTALLICINIFVGLLLVVLWHMSALPLTQSSVLIFIAALLFLFALHRPRWALWFFVGMLPYEVINLAPESLGIAIRPYQLFGGTLLLALLVRWASGRLPRQFFIWRWWDSAVVFFIGSGFIAALFANDFKGTFIQAIIVASFGVWFFLARYFVRGPKTAWRPLLFFFSSSLVVVLYGLWQSFYIARGSDVGNVMASRPNATFAEADWLGLFLVFIFALLCGVLYHIAQKHYFRFYNIYSIENLRLYVIGGALVGTLALLIAVASRSAWLGAVVVCILCVGYIVWRRQWRVVTIVATAILASLLTALALVKFIPLTTFELSNRAQSTASGLQKITIACDTRGGALQAEHVGKIAQLDELHQWNCRHINLEEIDMLESRGVTIAHVVRPDPSIGVRKEIYYKTLDVLKTDRTWLTGIGWNQSYAYLGTDGSGMPLNTSNIFLEVWLGGGLIGIFALTALLSSILWRSARALFAARVNGSLRQYGFFALLGLVGLIMVNLFNAGILLGFFWVFLGMMAGLRRV